MKTSPEAYLQMGKTLPKKILIIDPEQQVPYEIFPILGRALETITQQLGPTVNEEFKDIIQDTYELAEKSQKERINWQNVCEIRSKLQTWLDRYARAHKDCFDVIIGTAIQKIRLILLSKPMREDKDLSLEAQTTINAYIAAHNKLISYAVMGYKWSPEIEEQIIPPDVSFDTFRLEFIARFWNEPKKYFDSFRKATIKDLKASGVPAHIRRKVMGWKSQKPNASLENSEPELPIPQSNTSVPL